MKGTAEAYNISLNITDIDLSALPYDLGTLGCSVVYFPPSVTSNCHSMSCRNMDFDTVPMISWAPSSRGSTLRAWL